MKKIFIGTFILSCSLLNVSFGQYITAGIPDVAYPVPGTASSYEPDHMSNYHFHHSDGGYTGQFVVYSWSNPFPFMPNNAGIAYGFVDNTFSTIYDNGFLNISNAMELEVGTINIGGQKLIVATYYNSGGVYVDYYAYNYLGGLSPMGSFLLSSTGSKPRIDNHLDYATLITYEEPSGVVAVAIDAGSFPMGTAELLPGSGGGRIPDIAFAHESTGLNARIVYYRGSNILVYHKDFSNIGNPTVPYVLDDVNSGVQTSYIDIDCPDHLAGTEIKWAYTYDMSNKLFVRSFNNTSAASPYLFAVNDPFLMSNYLNFKPSIAFDDNQKIINVAWATKNTTGMFNKDIAVRYVYDGTPITPFGNYLVLSNASPAVNYGKHNVATLSKNNELPFIFAAFSMLGSFSPTNEDIKVKFKPVGSSTYNVAKDLTLSGAQMQALPNPFQTNFMLNAPAFDGQETLQILVVDMNGRQILQESGTMDELNGSLSTASNKWPTGMYSIQLKGQAITQQLKVVKQ